MLNPVASSNSARIDSSPVDGARLPAGSGTSSPGHGAPATGSGAALDRPGGMPGRAPSPPIASSPEGSPARRSLSEIVPANLNETLLDADQRSNRSDSMVHTSARWASVWDQTPGASRRLDTQLTFSQLALEGQATEAAEASAAPERSWRSVAGAIAGELARLARAGGHQALHTLSAVVPPMPDLRLAGVLAGHAIHQTVAVGLPTFVREMLASAVTHGLRSAPPPAVMTLQAAVGAANLALQVVREMREARNPDEAARAFHSLTPAQWQAKTPDEQAAMRQHTAKVSRLFTVLQVSSSITNLAVMHQAFERGDRAAALQPLANEVKIGVYAAMRDALQASFTMVVPTPPPAPANGPRPELAPGMAGAAHAAAAATYAGVNVLNAFLSDALVAAAVPTRGTAAQVLLEQSAAMSREAAWSVMARSSAIGAAINMLGETTDWFQRMQHFVNQTPGATQSLAPQLTGTDFGRVLDQAQARGASFNAIFSALMVAGRALANSDLPPSVQQLIGNVGLGAMTVMLDSPITGLWQAQEAVRQSPVPASPPQVDLEMGRQSVAGSPGTGDTPSAQRGAQLRELD